MIDLTNTEIIENKGIKALVRNKTSDSFVLKEVTSGEYNKLNILPTDVVVDFGLNIGIFSILAMHRGAKEIHSYEAEKENFHMAQYNLKLNEFTENVYLNNMAVIGDDDVTRPFHLNKHKNKGAHSLLYKKGRKGQVVTCININKVFESVKPTVVKMDIEGGEYETIKAVKSFSGIREFILEFHHSHLNDFGHHIKYKEILEILRKNFKTVHAREDTKEAWVSIIYCENAND